jgi:hypothetical protein
VAVWRCRVCRLIADHDGPDRPDGWFRLNMCGDGATDYSTPTLGLLCSTSCLLVAAMRPFGMDERAVRAWIAGELVA